MKHLLGAALVLTTMAVGVARAADAPASFEKKCKTCHSIGGQGGPMAKNGGPLDGIGAKHDEAWLTEFLNDPKAKNPASKMMKVKATPEEITEIVKYLGTLK